MPLTETVYARAFYVFPLVVSDFFLTSNFGRLLDFTCAVNASMITGQLNWHKKHKIVIQSDYSFRVHSSEKYEGQGFPARKLKGILGERNLDHNEDLSVRAFVKQLFEKFDRTIKRSEIYGNSEHTIIVPATTVKRDRLYYLQLPILIMGNDERNWSEKGQMTLK